MTEVRNIFPSMSVPREYYDDDYDGGFLEDMTGNMINPAVEHPLYLQAAAVATNGHYKTRMHHERAACQHGYRMAITSCRQVPGVGFNDVVIETPWHNMCAALEREEPLGSSSERMEETGLMGTALGVHAQRGSCGRSKGTLP